MTVRRQSVDVRFLHVEGQGSKALNRVDEEETPAAPADLAKRPYIRPQTTEVLDKTDRQGRFSSRRVYE